MIWKHTENIHKRDCIPFLNKGTHWSRRNRAGGLLPGFSWGTRELSLLLLWGACWHSLASGAHHSCAAASLKPRFPRNWKRLEFWLVIGHTLVLPHLCSDSLCESRATLISAVAGAGVQICVQTPTAIQTAKWHVCVSWFMSGQPGMYREEQNTTEMVLAMPKIKPRKHYLKNNLIFYTAKWFKWRNSTNFILSSI